MAKLWLSGSVILENVKDIEKLNIPGIDGIEFGFLSSERDLEIIDRFIKRNDLNLGFHHPIINSDEEDFMLSRCITSYNKHLREQALEQVKMTISIAAKKGAYYVLVHAPSKLIDKDKIEISKKRYKMGVNESLNKLEEMSQEFNIPIIIETDGPNYFYNTPESLKEMFEIHNSLQHCIDIMHFAVFTGKYKYSCTVKDLVKAISDVTFSIHLCNTISPSGTGEDPRAKGSRHLRLPVHPEQKPNNGWVNIVEVIEEVKSKNEEVKLVMEHIPFRSFDKEVLEKLGYNPEVYQKESINWIKSLV